MAVSTNAATDVLGELNRRDLRNFGLTMGTIVALLFGLLLPWLLGRPLPWWPWALCAALVAGAWLVPDRLRLVYRAWMRFGLIMGKITTPILLAVTYYAVVTPIALLRRVVGGDPLNRRLDRDAQSYRATSASRGDKSMERPF